MQRSWPESRYLCRKGAVSLFAAAALAGQVAIIVRLPEQFERVACWAMSLVWLGGTALMVRLARPRPVVDDGPPGRTVPPPAEDDRQPSGRMRAAWFMARAGGDTEVVAHIAQVPHALAELIVADARPGSGTQPG